jgi:hypothetical protein
MTPSRGSEPVTAPAVEPAEVALLRAKSGVCAACRHAEVLRSKRSAFLRCARADRDERYPRYPGLPVLFCRGFEAAGAAEAAARTSGS